MSDAASVTDTATNITSDVTEGVGNIAGVDKIAEDVTVDNVAQDVPPTSPTTVSLSDLSTHVTALSSSAQRFITDYAKLGDELKTLLSLVENLSSTYAQLSIQAGVE